MRLLVHGMQSSGATLFTYFLAQRPGCLALVDILNNYAAPRFESALDAVAKCVVTTAYPIAVHAERFKADRTILLLRDPRDNYFSLQNKNYRNHSGLIDEKFALIDTLFAERSRFDATIHYEDFLDRDPAVLDRIRALGWPVEEAYYDFERTFEGMLALLWQETPQLLQDEFEISFGNCTPDGLLPDRRRKPRDPSIDAKLETLCPNLLAHYRARERSAVHAQV
ncbi:MAG TPA: hypothetical protein VKQ29_04690 [Aliidongia sp.]|nr:hypothetical protein [Aliidongia sp.]